MTGDGLRNGLSTSFLSLDPNQNSDGFEQRTLSVGSMGLAKD